MIKYLNIMTIVTLLALMGAVGVYGQETVRDDLQVAKKMTIAEGNNAFTLDLYNELRTTEGDLFFSPFSVRTAFAMTYAIDFFWFDFMLAWIFKGLILRYGGMRLYRRAMPFFLGLILGEFVTSSFWTIVGAATGLQLYRTFPN